VITVLFFAQLREQLQCEKLTLALDSPIALSAIRERIIGIHPQWAEFLGGDKLLFSANHVLVKASHLVHDGDEIAFFPPVTGG
jgi:sulfur-carrier protein